MALTPHESVLAIMVETFQWVNENFTLLVELVRRSLKSVDSSSQDHELQSGHTDSRCHHRGTSHSVFISLKSHMLSPQLVALVLSCPGISSCTLSTWLTCRLASSEQQRMFLEREHSLHHSHEMTEKVRLDSEIQPVVGQLDI